MHSVKVKELVPLIKKLIFRFACPDLISKSGYWAKALGKFFMLLQIKNLAERYSIEKAILHFYVNSSGEMYYGINGGLLFINIF